MASERVTLTCRGCGREKADAARDGTDPPNAVRIDILCDRCDDGGGFPETFYFDAEGRQLNCDGDIMREARP